MYVILTSVINILDLKGFLFNPLLNIISATVKEKDIKKWLTTVSQWNTSLTAAQKQLGIEHTKEELLVEKKKRQKKKEEKGEEEKEEEEEEVEEEEKEKKEKE